MRFHHKLSHLSPLPPPPSSYQTGASCADSTLGGGALACTIAIGANHGVREPLGIAATIVGDRLNHATAADLLCMDSAAKGEPNGVL
jgi:hypothetical protein